MCKVCDHPQREAIDRAIIARDSLRKIGTMFGTDKNAIQRHKNICMKRILPAITTPVQVPAYQTGEQVAVAERVSLSIITRVSSLVGVLEQQASECASDKDRRNMNGTATALLKALELNARLTGELGPNQTNIQVNIPSVRDDPAFPIIIGILRECPVCFAKVEAALLEAGQ